MFIKTNFFVGIWISLHHHQVPLKYFKWCFIYIHVLFDVDLLANLYINKLFQLNFDCLKLSYAWIMIQLHFPD